MKIKSFISALSLILVLFIVNAKTSYGQIDVGVTAILSPTCPVVAGVLTPVTCVVTNFGAITQTSFPVGCLISGSIPTVATWTGMLAPSASDTFEFPVLFDFPVGPFSICVYTETIDTFPANDTTCLLCNGISMSVNEYQFGSKNKLMISPNPALGIFSLKVENMMINNASITITDILGKEVWRSDVLKPEFEVDFTNEPDGLYLINMKSPAAVSYSKLILVK